MPIDVNCPNQDTLVALGAPLCVDLLPADRSSRACRQRALHEEARGSRPPARRLVLCRLCGMLGGRARLVCAKAFYGDVLEITSPSRPVTWKCTFSTSVPAASPGAKPTCCAPLRAAAAALLAQDRC